jgi:hypothetical protein
MARMETDHVAVALFDAHHDPEKDEFHPAYSVAREFILDIKPDTVVIGGDWVTLDSLSNWNKAKPPSYTSLRISYPTQTFTSSWGTTKREDSGTPTRTQRWRALSI